MKYALWMKSKSWNDLFVCEWISLYFHNGVFCVWCHKQKKFVGELVEAERERKSIHTKSVLLWFFIERFFFFVHRVRWWFVLCKFYCKTSCAYFKCAVNDKWLHKQYLKCKHFAGTKKTETRTTTKSHIHW